MANLTIDIVTKYDQSLQGAQKLTDSYKKMGKQLIETSEEGKVADEIQKKYIASLNAALLGLENETNALAASKAQVKLLTQERAKMTVSLGSNAELVKKLSDAIEKETENMKSLEAESKKVSRSGMKEFEKSSGNAASKLLSVAKNILKFQLLMGPITGAIRGFKNTLSDSVKVAAEAEQVFNKLSTVFTGLEDSAKAAASAIANDLGVATSTAASALSTVGDLLQAQGMGTSESLTTATSWVSQFQDIIAFKDLNMTLEEFAQNFMSGAAGNLRNFRTFGSIVKESAVNARLAAEGYDKLTGSELELAKMTTRATMALEQQENAIGATEREWDSMLSINRRLNEAWKEYKENLGEGLNDILKPMKEWLTDILAKSNQLKDIFAFLNKGSDITIHVKNDSLDDTYLEVMKQVADAKFGKEGGQSLGGKWLLSLESGMAQIAGGLLGLAGRTEEQKYYSAVISSAEKQKTLTGDITAQGLADVAIASIEVLGHDFNDTIEAIRENGRTLKEDVIEDAREIVNAYLEQQASIKAFNTQLLTAAENYDNFTESLANLGHLKMEGTNYSSVLSMLGGNYSEDVASDWANNLQISIRQALRQMGSLSTTDFMDPIEMAMGVGNEEQAYKDWLNEIKDLYTLLYNRQKKFGDVEDKTLENVIALWGQVNDELTKYQNGINAKSAFDSGMASLQSSTVSYQRQMELVGLDEFESQVKQLGFAFEDMKAQFASFTEEELVELGIDLNALDAEFQNQIDAYKKLYDAQKSYSDKIAAQTSALSIVSGAQQSAVDRALVSAKTGKNIQVGERVFYNINSEQAKLVVEYNKTTKQLREDLEKLEKSVNDAGQTVYDFGNGISMTGEEINTVMYDELIGSMEDLADATEVVSTAWKDIGNRALGSTGTLGSVIQQFTDGEGDIWSDIVNALLGILENTEGWSDIAATLNQIFEMFEPVVDALIDLILSLPWEDIIFMLKIIASAITTIMAAVTAVQTVIKWFWDNLKTALHNLGEIIKHPLNANNRDKWDYRSWADLAKTLADQEKAYLDRLDRIWAVNEKIERNTNKNDLMKVLEDLHARGIINEQQYNEGARVIQKDMIFDPVPIRDSQYIVPQSSGSTVISYGGFTINISGSNPEETIRLLFRELEKNGVYLNANLGAF